VEDATRFCLAEKTAPLERRTEAAGGNRVGRLLLVVWERHRLEVGAEDAGGGRVNANAASGLQAAPCPEAMVDASLAIDMRAGMVGECALLNQLLDVMKLAGRSCSAQIWFRQIHLGDIQWQSRPGRVFDVARTSSLQARNA
jgi:hypothetical protein